MTVDFDALDLQAEVLDPDEVDELADARKSSGRPAQLVEWFESQDGARFIPADALGERTVKTDNGSHREPHDLNSLQNVAGGVRKYARLNGYEVNAAAKVRQGVLGIALTHEKPTYHEGRGRKPAAAPAE